MKPRKLFKIGEVIQYSGISRQTLHNYTMLGLIREAERTVSGHRLYGEDVFDRLEKIGRFKAHHVLREVKDLLDAEDAKRARAAAVAPVVPVAPAKSLTR